MATCPSNAVISSQEVTTGNLTCYDINGAIIGNVLTGNPPLSIGGTNKCPLQTSKIKTNLTTNSYQCENINNGILSNSNPCPNGWSPNVYLLSTNGILKYSCSNSTGTSVPFSCPYNITPTKNDLTGLMTGCIIPAKPTTLSPTSNSSSPTSSSNTSSSNTSSSNTSSSNTSSSNTSSSNTSSSNTSSSNTSSSFIESISNIGASTIIIGILSTVIVIGVISYFVFFRGSSNINKSIDVTNKGGYYYYD
jgi:hypothetical protein